MTERKEIGVNTRASGVLLHITSLPGGGRNGTFGREAARFVDFLADCGFSWWQVLPFQMPDEYGSPYRAYTAFGGNPSLIDFETLYLRDLITVEELARWRSGDLSEQDAEELRRRAASRLSPTGRAEVEEATVGRPEISRFCRFLALKKANGGKPWNRFTEGSYDREEWFFRAFEQYTFFEQWEEIHRYASSRGVRILGDMPVYVAWDSCDVWTEREQFRLLPDGSPAAVAGVPPDYFTPDGQLWGNPLYDWERMKEDGYDWWMRRLDATFRLFDGVRIDHFRAFASYWRIPADATTARLGSWMPGPGMDFVSRLRKRAGDRLVIAEDLGGMTPDVAELLRESGFPGMRVFQFGLGDGADSMHLPHTYSRHCVAYTGTHDNNTLCGCLEGIGRTALDMVRAYTGADKDATAAELCPAVNRVMLSSHADLVILPLQDMLSLGSEYRMNLPGSTAGNWRFRITAAQLEQIHREQYRLWNRIYGR